MNRGFENARGRAAFAWLGIVAGTFWFSGCALNRSPEAGIPAWMRISRRADETTPAAVPSVAAKNPLSGSATAEATGYSPGNEAASPPIRLTGESAAISEPPVAARAIARPAEAGKAEIRPLPKPARRTVLHADGGTFEEAVLQSPEPVLVDFYANWCGPCKRLAPVLEEVAVERPRGRVVKVDIERSPELAARYGVKSLPSLLVFKDGRVVSRRSGVADKARLHSLLDL